MDAINVETKAINIKKIWFHSQQHKQNGKTHLYYQQQVTIIYSPEIQMEVVHRLVPN